MSFTGYCIDTDVSRFGTYAGRAFSTTTNPTKADVEAMIENVYDEINARLSTVGVTVPVAIGTSPKAYAKLKYLNALGTAGIAQQTTFMRAAPNESASANTFLKMYFERLKFYMQFPSALIDAVLTTDAPVHPPTSSVWSAVAEIADTSDFATELDPPDFDVNKEW